MTTKARIYFHCWGCGTENSMPASRDQAQCFEPQCQVTTYRYGLMDSEQWTEPQGDA